MEAEVEPQLPFHHRSKQAETYPPFCYAGPVSSVTRPLRKDAERNRQRILRAAQEVFADRGLTASLDDIAHHAQVGVGTVYRRFPDKEALIDALFEARMEEFVAIAERALAQEDPWDGLVFFFEHAVGMQAADRGLKELVLCSHRGQERVRSVRQRIAPVVEQVVVRAVEAGVLRPDVSHHDMPLVNMMVGAVADAAQDVDGDLWRRYLGIVLDGLRAERTTATPLPVPALGDEDLDRALQAWRPPRR
jgi:AcrR family transcriptional regulator